MKSKPKERVSEELMLRVDLEQLLDTMGSHCINWPTR